MRKFLALGAAALLALAVVAPVAAADPTGDQTPLGASNVTISGVETEVTVDTVLSMDAPAVIDYGHGVPGATLPTSFYLAVSTNNAAGFTVTASASDLTDGKDTIPAINIKLDRIAVVANVAGTPALTAFAAADTAEQILTSDARTVAGANANAAVPVAKIAAHGTAAGDQYNFNTSIKLPFVESGMYDGTVEFVASTN